MLGGSFLFFSKLRFILLCFITFYPYKGIGTLQNECIFMYHFILSYINFVYAKMALRIQI